MSKRITLSIEFEYSDNYIEFGFPSCVDMKSETTDADLKAFATDTFIREITTLCDRKELRSYVKSFIEDYTSIIDKI